MEEAIREARKKAEVFLFKEIERISISIKKENENILFPSSEDTIVLRFEALSYLAHKNKKLKDKYAEELRNLWLHWKETQRAKKRGQDWKFWPWEGWIVSDTAMIRAYEILGIPGFEQDFNKTIEGQKGWLQQAPLNNLYCESNYWFIFRSQKLQNTLRKYIQQVAFMVLEYMDREEYLLPSHKKDNKDEFLAALDVQISKIIFLIISRLGGEYIKTAKFATDKFIEYQASNGSIFDDIHLTCSFVIALYLTQIDTSHIIQRKALKWLLMEQNIDGGWEPPDYILEDWLEDYRILYTVVVLETIDLVTNSKPLPPWIPIEKTEEVTKKKAHRVQDVLPLEVPPGTTWSEVTIRLRTSNTARLVFPGKVINNIDFRKMGFKDHKTKGPDKLWRVFVCLARNHGEISWETKGLPVKKSEELITDIKDIGNRLKHLFQIDEKPFKRYSKEKGYQSKFDISYAEDFKIEEEESEISKEFKEDIQKKESQRHDKAKWENVKEIKTQKHKK